MGRVAFARRTALALLFMALPISLLFACSSASEVPLPEEQVARDVDPFPFEHVSYHGEGSSDEFYEMTLCEVREIEYTGTVQEALEAVRDGIDVEATVSEGEIVGRSYGYTASDKSDFYPARSPGAVVSCDVVLESSQGAVTIDVRCAYVLHGGYWRLLVQAPWGMAVE